MGSAAGAGGCAPQPNWGVARDKLARRVVGLVNEHRATLGLARLELSVPLTLAARWKARHMARYGYLSHWDPAPPIDRSPAKRLKACGYRGSWWGENIAEGYPTPESVMIGWLRSPGHRSNIESPRWSAIGVGAAQSRSGTVYWVQDFGQATRRRYDGTSLRRPA